MELDDEDPKVRRNLVVFSGAVLLLAWMGVPLAAVAMKVAPPSAWSIDPFRAWFAAGAVLLYLAVRFHFSGGGRDAFVVLGNKYRWNMVGHVSTLMLREAGATAFHDWWSPPLASLLATSKKKFDESGYRGDRSHRVQIVSADRTAQSGWGLAGTGTFAVHWLNAAMNPASLVATHNEPVTYSLPLALRTEIRARALWLSWGYSDEAIKWMAPIWLCVGATAVIAFRATSALL